jgi:phosphatidylglycerophosphate synthase
MQTLLSGRTHPGVIAELALGLFAVVLLASLACRLLGAPAAFLVAAMMVYLAMAALLAWRLPQGSSLGAANRVTLARGVPVCLLAAALVAPSWLGSHAHWLVGSAALALAGDGLDGWVARRTGTESAFGARFDMELDAFLILVLSLCVIAADKAGAWVLAIGGMRYLLVAAMRPWPWLAAPLPESLRRKAVCVWQVASLLGALSPWVPAPVAGMLLALSLALLAWSFALDVRWLQRAARAGGPQAGPETPAIRTDPDHDR